MLLISFLCEWSHLLNNSYFLVTNFSSFAHMYFRDDYWSWTCRTLPWKFKNNQWISQYPSIFILPCLQGMFSLSLYHIYTTKLTELKKFSGFFFFVQGGCCVCVCFVFHLRNGEFSFCFCFTSSFLRRRKAVTIWNSDPGRGEWSQIKVSI